MYDKISFGRIVLAVIWSLKGNVLAIVAIWKNWFEDSKARESATSIYDLSSICA